MPNFPPSDLQPELDKYKSLTLAAWEYSLPILKQTMSGQELQNYYASVQRIIEKDYQAKNIRKLKQIWRFLTEDIREKMDFHFPIFIQGKTGYQIDLFRSFERKIERILLQDELQSEAQAKDVQLKLDFLLQIEAQDHPQIEKLKELLVGFERK